MRLVDIDATTEGTFFRCLHDEAPADPRLIAIRRRWYEQHRPLGLRAKVLFDEASQVVGLCQYLPVEHSPFEGHDLLAILCMWVHGYEHLVGNQQGRGYGRFMLEQIEADARESGYQGVAAWGMDFPYWNPVSFYEHMGYQRADAEGLYTLVWKALTPDAQPPRIRRDSRDLPSGGEKVHVTSFLCGWCLGEIEWCLLARDAAAGLEDRVQLTEYDISRSPSLLPPVYLERVPCPVEGPPWTVEQFREELLKQCSSRAEGPR